jgi:hypothetical protein
MPYVCQHVISLTSLDEIVLNFVLRAIINSSHVSLILIHIDLFCTVTQN